MNTCAKCKKIFDPLKEGIWTICGACEKTRDDDLSVEMVRIHKGLGNKEQLIYWMKECTNTTT